MDDFLLRAITAGLLVAIMAGTLGSAIIWRRMAYFGDALSHSALLGVVLGLILDINITFGVLFVSVLVALLLVVGRKRLVLQEDALLGVLAHGTLALGLVLWGMQAHASVDLFAYLFGDLFAVSQQGLLTILLVTMIVLVGFKLIYRPLLLISIDQDIALAEGVNVDRIMLIYILLIALFVAVALQVVGIMLTTALLIIPSAGARLRAKSPLGMIRGGVIIAVLAVLAGVALAMLFDLVIGPAIVLTAAIIFTVLWITTTN